MNETVLVPENVDGPDRLCPALSVQTGSVPVIRTLFLTRTNDYGVDDA